MQCKSYCRIVYFLSSWGWKSFRSCSLWSRETLSLRSNFFNQKFWPKFVCRNKNGWNIIVKCGYILIKKFCLYMNIKVWFRRICKVIKLFYIGSAQKWLQFLANKYFCIKIRFIETHILNIRFEILKETCFFQRKY